MNGIQRTEQAIKEGAMMEPVMRFRGYALTSSEAHLAAGSDWRLLVSAESKEGCEEMIKDHGFELDFHVVIDGEAK